MQTEAVNLGRKAARLFELDENSVLPEINATAVEVGQNWVRRSSLWVPTFREGMQAAVSDWFTVEKKPTKAGLHRVITRYIRTYIAGQAAQVIATEAQFGAQTMLQTLVRAASKQKVWISQRDGRVRASHVLLDGQKRPHGKPFRIPGTRRTAMHPGDFGVEAEDINCRCASVPYSSTIDPAKVWGRLNRFVRTWEQRLKQRLRRALNAIRSKAFGKAADEDFVPRWARSVEPGWTQDPRQRRFPAGIEYRWRFIETVRTRHRTRS